MQCPGCGSSRVFPSRLRNAFERLRNLLTDQQPYRCHQCGWRKWSEVRVHQSNSDVHPDDLRTGRVPKPLTNAELDRLDTPSASA